MGVNETTSLSTTVAVKAYGGCDVGSKVMCSETTEYQGLSRRCVMEHGACEFLRDRRC